MPLFQNKLASLKVAKSKDGKLVIEIVGFDVSEDFAEDGSKGDGNVCEFLSILFLRISSAFIQKSLMSCMMSLACMSLGFIIGKYNSIQ